MKSIFSHKIILFQWFWSTLMLCQHLYWPIQNIKQQNHQTVPQLDCKKFARGSPLNFLTSQTRVWRQESGKDFRTKLPPSWSAREVSLRVITEVSPTPVTVLRLGPRDRLDQRLWRQVVSLKASALVIFWFRTTAGMNTATLYSPHSTRN